MSHLDRYCVRMHIMDYQWAVGAWADRNFGGIDTGPVGLVEEVGELCRAWVKRKQGIRGTYDEWTAELKKEAADVFIKLAQICHDERFSLEAAVASRWDEVKQRDFVTNPIGHGLPQDEVTS